MWSHKKFKGAQFVGHYITDDHDRSFFIVAQIKGKKKTVSFESWQAAKQMGWKYTEK